MDIDIPSAVELRAGRSRLRVVAVTRLATPLLTTPTIARYRARLQAVVRLKTASISRGLVSVKGYCAWAIAQDLVRRDPARAVKLVAEETRWLPIGPCYGFGSAGVWAEPGSVTSDRRGNERYLPAPRM